MGKKSPRETDAIVGRNIRIRRMLLRLSQTDLANQLGLTFQQVQKYENGKNRIGVSRLIRIAEVLQVPAHALFEGAGANTAPTSALPSYFSNAQALRLAVGFAKVDDTAIRRAIVSLVEDIAESERSRNGTKQ